MNKSKLKQARKKIDSLDRKIFKLVARRTKVVNYMLDLKKYKNQIVDHKRIKTILRSVRIKSIKNKIDPKITQKIWTSMIWAYVDYQKKNFKKK
tara:strand:+ start:196 stop:477 length:282 start_codon:yes stop_codon:yes gene_type:complete